MKLDWRPAPAFGALAFAAAVAMAGAIMVSRPELVAFAAPMLAALVVVARSRPHSVVSLEASAEVARCFEGEQVTLQWRLIAPPDAEVALEGAELVRTGDRLTATLTAHRWGNYPLELSIRASTGMWTTEAMLSAGMLRVYPYAKPEDLHIPVSRLPDRIGTHLTRHAGPGVEFAGIRQFQAGDALRTVNWIASARRNDLHVNERMTERAADVVVAIDTFPEPDGPAREALETCVHGAVSTAQAALRRGDRAAIVCLGQKARWLSPGSGRRQFYQVLDAVLEGQSLRQLHGTLIPRAAAPPGAVVVAFSPLLDTQFGLSLVEMRRRGHPVLAVDVLTGPPFADKLDPLMARLWRLERAGMYRDLATAGIEVVRWQS